MNAFPEQTSDEASPLNTSDVARWRDQAEAFFVEIRRELSCLTGEPPAPSKLASAPRTHTPRPPVETSPTSLASIHSASHEDEFQAPKSNDFPSLPAVDFSPKASASEPTPAAEPAATSPTQSKTNSSPAPLSPTAPNSTPVADKTPITESTPQPPEAPEPEQEIADEVDRLALLKKQIAEKLAQQSPANAPATTQCHE